ncbi:MAG: hypothetical protein HKN71_07350 [Gemmatimonadetes bacterium]|nr:hypothetical protein [Gemmatimonadota bacterium]
MRFATTALASIFLAGCGLQSTGDAPPIQRTHAVDFVAYGTNAEFATIDSEAEKRRIHEQNLALFEQAEPASGLTYHWFFRSERPLAEKDAVAAGLLDTHTGVEWIFARQKIAAPLLELHLRTGSEDHGTIHRYLQVLVETGNPSADLVADALDLLGDRIPGEERLVASGAASDAARSWLIQVECDGCAAAALSPSVEGGGLPAKVHSVSRGLQRLATTSPE